MSDKLPVFETEADKRIKELEAEVQRLKLQNGQLIQASLCDLKMMEKMHRDNKRLKAMIDRD